MAKTEDYEEEVNQPDAFFSFDDEEEEGYYEESAGPIMPKLLATGVMLLASILALFLLIGGIRTFSEARANEGYENRSWVISGELQDLTRDLQGDSNVAIYQGKLPQLSAMDGKTFVSEIADSQQVQAGVQVKFRGSQAGSVRSDFEQEVDALLVQVGESELMVARTGQKGSLTPVTDSTVSSQKAQAMGLLGGAIAVFAAGVFVTFRLIRKQKPAAELDD